MAGCEKNKGYRFNATIHCEAALASLTKYANDMPIQHAQDHPGVVGCLQVSFTVVIGKFINLTEEQNIEPKYNRCVQRVGKSWTAWKAPTTDSVSVAAILPFMQVELPPWLLEFSGPSGARGEMHVCRTTTKRVDWRKRVRYQ